MTSIINMLPRGGGKAIRHYYFMAENCIGLSDDSNQSNIVSITGTNTDITNKQKAFGNGWNEYNISAQNSIVVRLFDAVKATHLIYEAYAQNMSGRRFDWCALDGSNDGSNWTELVYQTIGADNSHSQTPHVIPLTRTGKYTYYRYRVQTNNYVQFRHPFDIIAE